MKSDTSPVVQGSVWSFAFGDTVFAVDAARAGRISELSLGGRNILTVQENPEQNNWGSTFWPSPQSDWGWPPPAEIDPGAYKAEVKGGTLLVASAVAPGLGLAVSKRFSVDVSRGAVHIEYGIMNHGRQPRSVAPWEISRVAAGGLTFFPMGDGQPWKGPQEVLPLRMLEGIAWLASDTTAASHDQKVFADGREGWIAHVAGDLLLVKAFADTTPAEAAPGEAEIELYTDPGRTYVEVENQGAYVKLEPGQASSWPVRWFLRKLDPALPVRPGSARLVELVRALVTQA